MQSEQRRRKLQERMSQYAHPYARATGTDPRQKSATNTAGRHVLLQWLIRLVAFDPAHRDEYPLAWWVVLPLALLFARLLVLLVEFLVGPSALVALPVVVVLLVRQFYRWCEKRRLRILFEQFPDALSMLV